MTTVAATVRLALALWRLFDSAPTSSLPPPSTHKHADNTHHNFFYLGQHGMKSDFGTSRLHVGVLLRPSCSPTPRHTPPPLNLLPQPQVGTTTTTTTVSDKKRACRALFGCAH